MDVAVRLYDPATDEGFVRSSWFRGAHEAPRAARIPTAGWGRLQGEHVSRCLDSSLTLVAADPEDVGTLVGWICAARRGDALVVHWVYVPRALRGLGVASELLRSATHGVSVGLSLAESRNLLADTVVIQTQESKHDGWIAEVAKRRGIEIVFDPSAALGVAA